MNTLRQVALVFLFGWASIVTAETVLAPAKLVEVALGVWVRPGQTGIVFESANVANIGAIVGDRCSAVIDTGGSIEEGFALRNALQKHNLSPVCYVITSHGHPDHLLGNFAFADIENIQFIGHANMARSTAPARSTWLSRLAAQRGFAVPEGAWIMPDKLVSDKLSLDLGGRTIEINAYADAHSQSDLSVFDPATGVLWLSDLLFAEHLPVLAGSIDGWLELHETFDSLPIKAVIPGHGPPLLTWPSKAYEAQFRYLQSLRQSVAKAINKGESLLDAQSRAATQTDEQWPLFSQYHARNLARAWAELEWLD